MQMTWWFSGSLISLVGARHVGPWLDSLITAHGDVVRWIIVSKTIFIPISFTFLYPIIAILLSKLNLIANRCSVPGQKIVLVRENPAKKEGKEDSAAAWHPGESLDRRNLLDVTLQHLVSLVRKLGAKVQAWWSRSSRGCWFYQTSFCCQEEKRQCLQK